MRNGIRKSHWRLLSMVAISWVVSGGLLGEARGAGASTRKISSTLKIFGIDDRRYIANTEIYPWSAIGLVEAVYGREIRVGTGAMIGNRTVITCGHVVYDSTLKESREVYFIPGKNGRQEPFGRVRVVSMSILEGWRQNADDNHDIALLVLESAVGPRTGYLRIAVEADSFFNGPALSTAGYPGDRGDGQYLYLGTGYATGMDGNMILETLDSEPGQSGAPVWVGNLGDGSGRLVGVLKGILQTMQGTTLNEQGITTRINAGFGEWINRELAKHDNVTQDLTGANATNFSGNGSLSLAPLSAPDCGACATGTDQALAMSGMVWGGMIFRRRRKRRI